MIPQSLEDSKKFHLAGIADSLFPAALCPYYVSCLFESVLFIHDFRGPLLIESINRICSYSLQHVLGLSINFRGLNLDIQAFVFSLLDF